MSEQSPLYPPRSEVRTVQDLLTHHLGEALVGPNGIVVSISDLTLDELNAMPSATANSIGFEAWHVFRTVDNIIRYVFLREPTIWLEQGLDVAWGLPKAAQGTGADHSETRSMRFPEATLLAGYGRDVATSVLPAIAAMDEAFLNETVTIRPFGEMTRLASIGTNLVSHANQHLGSITMARDLLGKPYLGI
ncbi:MAG: DinB family protein [Chloroflexi bacterium]|nr:MAG: DinB family protein [Chloroflexota bacterium]